MNTAIIESITWHKDQLFKLLNSDQDIEKYEGSIYNLEKDFDEILEKAKTRKKVLVHRKGKTFYREQEVGRKEPEIAHRLKVGDTIEFKGKDAKVTRINPLTKTIELDNKSSYHPKEINKYGKLKIKGKTIGEIIR